MRDAEGRTISAQVFRPPWPPARSVLEAGLADALRRASERPGERMATPGPAG